jgi:hypothetical protein
MNIYGLVNWDKDWVKILMFLHQQAKFWDNYSRKFIP